MYRSCQHFKTTVSCADDEKLLCITALNSHFTINMIYWWHELGEGEQFLNGTSAHIRLFSALPWYGRFIMAWINKTKKCTLMTSQLFGYKKPQCYLLVLFV